MSDGVLYLQFDGMSQPVELIDCAHLLAKFSLVFPGWSIVQVLQPRSDAVLSLRFAQGEYSLSGKWLEQPLKRDDEVDAICALVAELMKAYVRQDDRLLCLHGAAAEFAGKLVVFPSQYRAGKSILSACLAAAGIRIFCDDILPVSLARAEGIAPGLAPRLRLPLPANLNRRESRYIESHNRLQGRNYFYLDLDGSALAPRGSRLPVGAFVLLERAEGQVAELEEVGEADVLRQLVWQNFAREAEAPRILRVLGDIAAGAQRYRLRYDRAGDAVRLLAERFDHWQPAGPTVSRESAIAAAKVPIRCNEPQPGQFRRRDGIDMVQVDGQSFLADGEGAAIHHLNPLGSAIWSLLEEPIEKTEIVDLLATAFPELERGRIEHDVDRLLDDLAARQLVLHRPR